MVCGDAFGGALVLWFAKNREGGRGAPENICSIIPFLGHNASIIRNSPESIQVGSPRIFLPWTSLGLKVRYASREDRKAIKPDEKKNSYSKNLLDSQLQLAQSNHLNNECQM